MSILRLYLLIFTLLNSFACSYSATVTGVVPEDISQIVSGILADADAPAGDVHASLPDMATYGASCLRSWREEGALLREMIESYVPAA